MGEDIEVVGDVPAEDLWADAMDRLAPVRPPDLDRDAGEFALRDVMERRGWKMNTARRTLEDMVERGELSKAERIDPETSRKCWGYWWREDADE